MDFPLLILLAVIVVLGFFTIFIYNNLVTLKHSVSKSWSNIDVLLRQRHEEIPKLVGVCKQYMQYEQETMENIIQARTAVMDARLGGDIKQLGQAESQLRVDLGHLFALAENYPELKANNSFQQLQGRITQLENGIADRREVYNEAVNINNVRIEQFPDVIVARLFNFKDFSLLEFTEKEKSDVNMQAIFNR